MPVITSSRAFVRRRHSPHFPHLRQACGDRPVGTEQAHAVGACWLRAWFLVTSDHAEFVYKTTDYHAPTFERSPRWNDPALDIEWPMAGVGEPQLKHADAQAPLLAAAELFA